MGKPRRLPPSRRKDVIDAIGNLNTILGAPQFLTYTEQQALSFALAQLRGRLADADAYHRATTTEDS